MNLGVTHFPVVWHNIRYIEVYRQVPCQLVRCMYLTISTVPAVCDLLYLATCSV